jgi:hypothetical protein
LKITSKIVIVKAAAIRIKTRRLPMTVQTDSNAVRYTTDNWGAVLVALVPFAGVALLISLFMLMSNAFQSNAQLQNILGNILAMIVIFWYLGVFVVGWV